MRRGLFLIYVTFTCLTMFVYCETVLAGSMNSKAGITFSNSYNPDITTDSIIPDGSKVVDNTSDDRTNKKLLPKTGGHSSSPVQYVGVGIMLVALVVFLVVRNNNRENRNNVSIQ